MIEYLNDPSEVKFNASSVQEGTHEMVKMLVRLRYDFSAAETEVKLHSGALSQFRKGWFTAIVLASEELRAEKFITTRSPYYRRLLRFTDKYSQPKAYKNDRMTTKDVDRGNGILDSMLDDLYPTHRLDFKQVKQIRIFHTVEKNLGDSSFKPLIA